MKKVVFIIPYFGKLHNYFHLFLASCGKNPDIDFLFVSDLEFPDLPPNCSILKLSFQELVNRINQKLGFISSLKQIYKIVDFKPMYGDLFEKEIAPYDYWGFCDCDMILGNLKVFLESIDMAQYEKIFCHGHMTILKNNDKMRRLYQKQGNFRREGIFDFREAFSTKCVVHFDEGGGFTAICDYYDIQSYEEVTYADINFAQKPFMLAQPVPDAACPCIFKYEDGSLLRVMPQNTQKRVGGVFTKPYIYIHLQKSKMDVMIDKACDTYHIVPNAFIPKETISEEVIHKYAKNVFYPCEVIRKLKHCVRRFSIARIKLTLRNKRLKRSLSHDQNH